MQSTSYYRVLNPSQIPPLNALNDLLCPTHLALHAIVRCKTLPEPSSDATFQNEYPTWMHFTGEIEQFGGQEKLVCLQIQNILTPIRPSTFDFASTLPSKILKTRYSR